MSIHKTFKLVKIDVDISSHALKHLDQFLEAGIDIIATVCDNAAEACPIFPGDVKRNVPFEDPPLIT